MRRYGEQTIRDNSYCCMLTLSERHSDSHAHSSQPRTVDLTLMKSEAQGCNLMLTEGPDRVWS